MERVKDKGGNWPWIGAALLAQAGWGVYPVLARYLQTVSLLPSMSIIAFGSFVALTVVGFTFLPHIEWKALRLVSALIVAALLLDEPLTSFWQNLGVLMVLTTVTWTLWQQRGAARLHKRAR